MPTSLSHDEDQAASPSITCHDPADASRPCPLCGGFGFVRLEVPLGDPRWGKLHRCKNNRPEANLERQRRLRKLSNMDSLSSKTFENFILGRPGYTKNQHDTLEFSLHMVMTYAQKPEGWLLLEGGYGTGKTHLAAAVGNACLNRGEQVIFLTTPDLLDHLRSTYSTSSEVGFDETFERLRNVYMLILDDLGVENPSEWAQEKLYQLLNHRYVTSQPTVFTTNGFSRKLDPRILSRLRDRNLVKRAILEVPDFRDNTSTNATSSYSRLDLYRDFRLSDFDIHTNLSREHYENLAKVLKAMQEFAHNPEGWIMLMGTHGTGKTHLAAGAANEISQNHPNMSIIFSDVNDLMSDLRATFDSQSHLRFSDLMTGLHNVDLLVLENVPADNPKNAWVQEKLFQILDVRYMRRNPTIITSCEPMEKISQRLHMRLIDQRVSRNFTILAPPYALRLRKNQAL